MNKELTTDQCRAVIANWVKQNPNVIPVDKQAPK